MEINVKDMPLDRVYRFDVNKYVYTTMLKGTRDGIRILKKPITEVFEINNEGNMDFIASGDIVNNGGVDNYTRGFTINDSDKNEMLAFRITMHLQEINNKELEDLCEAVAINHGKNK